MGQFIIFLKNHWFLWLAFFVLLGAIAFDEGRKNVKGVRKISPQQAVDLINQEETIIIDFRDQHAFNSGHIIGAIPMLVSDYNLVLKKLGKDTNKSILLLGKDEMQVIGIGAKLQKSGFAKLYTISGGIIAWKNASLPLTKK